MNIAVLGAQNGDEAKGRVVHDFSPNYDWVVRFSGGANAGHTIYRDGKKYVHNLMPSFDWRSERPKAFLGSGMVICIEQLSGEVNKLYSIDKSLPSRVYVDPEAFIVTNDHKEEDKQNNGHIGSTNRGIGPAYSAKMSRKGIRIKDLLDNKAEHYAYPYIKEMMAMGVNFKGVLALKNEMKNSSIIFEGAQGVMLDINHGAYPFVSCGDSTVAGIYASGFHFAKLDKVYGVAKCYLTKVGAGPFPTEIFGEESDYLREKGQEYGATTGRPRRIGWIDLPAIRYAAAKGGITHLILTKFDVLNEMKDITLCAYYEQYDQVNYSDNFFDATPSYVTLPGWENAKELGLNMRRYIDFISKMTELPVEYISYGTDSKDLIKLNGDL